jgi:hypothetical protein
MGGALLALPVVVALFKVDILNQRLLLVVSGFCFVLGTVFVCNAQAFAFFTFARRSEVEFHHEQQQRLILNSAYYPETTEPVKAAAELEDVRKRASYKRRLARRNRRGAIVCLWTSGTLFYAGLFFGTAAILLG